MVLGAVIGIAALGIGLHAKAARSSETQHHGLEREGVVASVKKIDHASKHDWWTTFDYVVKLSAPVGARTETVVHDPTHDFQRYSTGDRVSLRVDPEDTGYAELPGRPVEEPDWYMPILVLSLILIGMVALIAGQSRSNKRKAATPEAKVRSLRAGGRLAEAAEHVDELGPFGVPGDDPDTSLGASVLEEYGDQLATTDSEAANAAYRRAAELQRAFASTATAGGEGLARMQVADRIEAKTRPATA